MFACFVCFRPDPLDPAGFFVCVFEIRCIFKHMKNELKNELDNYIASLKRIIQCIETGKSIKDELVEGHRHADMIASMIGE